MGKIDFEQFKNFLEKQNALSGFNLTNKLMQQLFAQLDSHKKGFLTDNDWQLNFAQFNVDSQLMLELANLLSVSFVDCKSAFEYFISLRKDGVKRIQEMQFVEGFVSLSNKRFKAAELHKMWNLVSKQ
jgi:hypothetical protein